jgi:hypothetical protein
VIVDLRQVCRYFALPSAALSRRRSRVRVPSLPSESRCFQWFLLVGQPSPHDGRPRISAVESRRTVLRSSAACEAVVGRSRVGRTQARQRRRAARRASQRRRRSRRDRRAPRERQRRAARGRPDPGHRRAPQDGEAPSRRDDRSAAAGRPRASRPMAGLYVDTSALGHVLLREPGAELIRATPRLGTGRGVECASGAISRSNPLHARPRARTRRVSTPRRPPYVSRSGSD